MEITIIAAAAERIRAEFGRLDVLVNNAGISHAGKPGRSLEERVEAGRPSVTSLDEVQRPLVNLFGSRCSARRAPSRARMARSRGDLVLPA